MWRRPVEVEAMAAQLAPAIEEQTDTRLQSPYQVILMDDDDHTYDYVIEMLGKVFGHSPQRAFEMAREVDASGRSVVFSGPLEQAEFKKDKVHGYGADPRIPRCAGSMTAVLESVDA
jgi:ATP-dependent Clp protease adaptor protein ClpS